jgi:Fatty acid desaturase
MLAGTQSRRIHVQAARAHKRSIRARAAAVEQQHAPAKPPGPVILNGQVLHSIEPHRLDVIRSMETEGWVERELTKMLKPVAKSWQPADYLPDGADPDFLDKVRASIWVYKQR